jgi:type IV secretory pathway VirB10-like protein
MQISPLPRLLRALLPGFVPCCLTALVVLAAALPAQAQWAWRDANGRITASDRAPPRDVADKDIISRPKSDKRQALNAAPVASAPPGASPAAPNVATPNASSPAAAASAPATPLEREVQARKSKAEQEQASKKAAEDTKLASQRADNCQRARSQVATLDSGIRIARTNAKGEREMMDDTGRAAEARKAQDVITSDCR